MGIEALSTKVFDGSNSINHVSCSGYTHESISRLLISSSIRSQIKFSITLTTAKCLYITVAKTHNKSITCLLLHLCFERFIMFKTPLHLLLLSLLLIVSCLRETIASLKAKPTSHGVYIVYMGASVSRDGTPKNDHAKLLSTLTKRFCFVYSCVSYSSSL